MGGEGSEIYDSTDKVLLESAYFRPADIKKTSTELGLSTESSYRFERGVDIEAVDWASARATSLMNQLIGAVACKGVIDKYPSVAEPVVIKFRTQRARDLIGVDISDDEMFSILESLKIKTVGHEDDAVLVEVPVFRHDLQIEADIIEEIARIYGLDKIPLVVPKAMIVPDADDSEFRALKVCRETVAALGCSEIMHYSFLSAASLDVFDKDDGSRVVLPNPVSEEYAVLRNSLIPQMGEALAGNLSRQVECASLFELGRVFLKSKGGEIREEDRLCVGLMGDVGGAMEIGRDSDVSHENMFLWMKGLIERLCGSFGANEMSFSKASAPYFEDGCALSVSIGGDESGVIGLLSSGIRSDWRMSGPVAIAEINVKKLLKGVFNIPELKAVPAFPAVARDMALLVPQSVTHEQVMDVISKSAPSELTDVRLFDIYTGEGIGDGKRSLAYSLVYRSLERTLTDEDANGYHEAIKSALKKKLNVEIR
jgi:phenylalanyl-tRNA synthetase beta chain